MAVQTEYNETLDAGRLGALADLGHNVLISRTIEGAAVGFAVPLAQGTNDKGARATTTGDTAVVGVTVRDRSSTDDQFAVGDTARVMTEGVIWVSPVAAVAAGDPVHVIVADATFSNTGGLALAGSRYEDSGAAGSLVRIRLA